MSTETIPTAQRLAAAIEQLEKLVRLSEQLPARLEAAKSDVVTILDELGIEAKPARTKRSAGAKSPAKPASGSMAESILRHLPGSIPGIAGALGEAKLTGVSAAIRNMERGGRVEVVPGTEPPVYRLVETEAAAA